MPTLTWTRTVPRPSPELPASAFEPHGFAAGDTNLYRYVGNDPTNRIDPSGLAESVPGQSSETDGVAAPVPIIEELLAEPAPVRYQQANLDINDTEISEGITAAIERGKTTKGKSGLVQNDSYTNVAAKLNNKFIFVKAFAGANYKLGDAVNRDGAYVVIRFSDPNLKLTDKQSLRFIQVMREYHIVNNEHVSDVPAPAHAVRRARSGYDNKGEPKATEQSVGWRVDNQDASKSGYYGYDTTVKVVQSGNASRPLLMWDRPSFDQGTAVGHGKEFITMAVLHTENEPDEFLGYVRWGFFVGENGTVTMSPAKPDFGKDVPDEFKNAILRWNKLPDVRKLPVPKDW